MSDPYRTSGFPCPGCKSAGMRPLGTRLICDHCECMMLQVEDLAGNIGAADSVTLHDDGAAPAMACPRCLETMRVADLQVNGTSYGHFPYCPADGVWFQADGLIELFDSVGRRAGSGKGSGKTYGGVGGQYIAGRERPEPLQFTVPTSRFDGMALGCPLCTGAQLRREHDRWPCPSCRGNFVENTALEAMVMDMVGQPWSMPPPTGREGQRGCPVCTASMIVEELEAVTIDRCGEHGVWFDPTELGSVLHNAGSDRRRGVIGWLKRVF